MGYYLSKYKGKYKLRTEYDKERNCFYRDSDGKLIENEVYIDCKKGRIVHYGGSILTAYIEPCGEEYRTGKFKEVYCDSLNYRTDEHKEYVDDACTIEKEIKKVEVLKNYIKSFNIIKQAHKDEVIKGSVTESDVGGSFRFSAKHIEGIAKDMGAYTGGSKMSPFSKRNLKNIKYDMPKEDIAKMKLITKPLLENKKIYLITKAYDEFAKSKDLDMKKLEEKYMMKPKEIFHKLGYFDELIVFLSKIKY